RPARSLQGFFGGDWAVEAEVSLGSLLSVARSAGGEEQRPYLGLVESRLSGVRGRRILLRRRQERGRGHCYCQSGYCAGAVNSSVHDPEVACCHSRGRLYTKMPDIVLMLRSGRPVP